MIYTVELAKYQPGQDEPVQRICWDLTKLEYEDAAILMMARFGPGEKME
jgi:hypothetical protein